MQCQNAYLFTYFLFRFQFLHVLHLSSSCKRVFCYIGLKSELVNILDAIYEARHDLTSYYFCAYAQTQFVYKLIYPIFEIKGLVNWSCDNGVKLIRASEHICLHNNKDRGDTLANCGRGCGVCFVRLTESCFIFSTMFQTRRRLNCLILGHTDKVRAR